MLSMQDLIQVNRDLRKSLTSRLAFFKSHPSLGKRWPLLYLAVQVLRLHEALELLAERGYGREAGILLRSMFEAAVNALWIVIDLDARIERHNAYQYFAAQKYRDLAEQRDLMSKRPVAERRQWEKDSERVLREVERGKRKYGFKAGQYWSGKPLKEMAKEAGKGWLMRYESVYRIYSDVVHSNIATARDYVSQIPTGGVLITAVPKMDHSQACLREAYLYLATAFEIANDCLYMDLDSQLDEAWVNMAKIIPGAPGRPLA